MSLCICTVTMEWMEEKWENYQPIVVYTSPVKMAKHSFGQSNEAWQGRPITSQWYTLIFYLSKLCQFMRCKHSHLFHNSRLEEKSNFKYLYTQKKLVLLWQQASPRIHKILAWCSLPEKSSSCSPNNMSNVTKKGQVFSAIEMHSCLEYFIKWSWGATCCCHVQPHPLCADSWRYNTAAVCFLLVPI